MSHGKNDMIVEAKVLHDLQKGSYEELLQSLDRAVIENQDLFGDDAVLFASHLDRVIVINEGGQFFSANYTNRDGVIRFGKVDELDVNAVTEESIVASAVDNFFEGESLAEGLKGLMDLRQGIDESPIAKTRESLSRLFGGGRLWRRYVDEHSERVSNFAWDADYGSLKIDVRPIFSDRGSDVIEDEQEVMSALINLERRLVESLNKTTEIYKAYQEETKDLRSDEADQVLSRFESFASDYIDHLTEVSNFASNAVRRGRDGNVSCAAITHDEIAARFKELELGGRFVRKVSSQFLQQQSA